MARYKDNVCHNKGSAIREVIMNIILINHYAGSPNMGMEFRPYYFAREWIKHGHEVHIYGADYSHLRTNNPKAEKDFEEQIIDGIHYHWVKTRTYEGNGAKRAITMAQFISKMWLHSKKIVKEIKPDIIIASSTYPLDTYVGQKMRRLTKGHAKLIHEVHDMWPATLTEIGGMSKKNPFVITMQIGENSAYKKSDYVVSLPPSAKAYMMEHGMKEDRFVHIANGVVLEDWENSTPIPEEYQEVLQNLKNDNKFIVGYFGGHALSNALMDLIKVAENVMELGMEQIQFVLVGKGVEKPKLQEYVRKNNVTNVTFLDPIVKSAIPQLVSYFDCVYIGSNSSPLYRFGVTANKIYDSMMAGKIMLYAIEAGNNYAEQFQCGITVIPGNIEDIVKGLKKIIHMSEEERNEMGKNGQKAVKEYFNYDVLSKEFERLF